MEEGGGRGRLTKMLSFVSGPTVLILFFASASCKRFVCVFISECVCVCVLFFICYYTGDCLSRGVIFCLLFYNFKYTSKSIMRCDQCFVEQLRLEMLT